MMLSDAVHGGKRTVVLAKRQREDLLPPGLVVTRRGKSAFFDVAVCCSIEAGMDDARMPHVVQEFGLNYRMEDRNCLIYDRLFEAGFSAVYVRHVLKNLCSCLFTAIGAFEAVKDKGNTKGEKCP